MGLRLRVNQMVAGLVFLLVSLCFCISLFAGEVIIIVNKNVSESKLSASEIKDIFLGEKTSWQDNKKVNFVILKDSEVHREFLEKYVDKTPMGYNSFWKKLVFVGKGKAPTSFSSAKELVDYVAKTDGAIGYISSEEKTAEVKIIEPK
ncbi:MAG: substrate-binding domain-containing protein [Desulforegulaceae bacterium]|nr:substrate-binding domain-containing protein [Desulforegulaceae bacterium]